MTHITKLKGRFLDQSFRRVEVYVCDRKPEPHKFDIAVKADEQTAKEKEWLSALRADKCPLCGASI